AALRSEIEQRIGRAPRLRSRLAEAPFGRGFAWVDDPAFDVSRHVRRVAVGGPVERLQLLQLVGGLMSERLRRDRALWSIDVVEPLLDGRVAAIWRIHHAMADGGAAMSIGSAVLWRDSPEPEPAPPLPPPEPMPASASLLAALARDRARRLARDFK